MKKDSVCCPPSLIPSRETSLFYLLGVLIALYMLAGAAVFSSLERPAELQAHQLWENRLRDFSHEHRVSCEDLKHLLSLYEEARTAGIRTKQGRALWDISGAFYFVGTVVSTIGKSRWMVQNKNRFVTWFSYTASWLFLGYFLQITPSTLWHSRYLNMTSVISWILSLSQFHF